MIRGQPSHLTLLSKAFRRVNEAHPGCPNENALACYLEEGRVYILLDQQRVYAYAIVTREIGKSLFGDAPGASGEEYALMEDIGLEEDNIILIQAFGIDPIMDYSEKGKLIFDFLASNYHKPVMLIRVESDLSAQKKEILRRYNAKEYFRPLKIEGRLFIKKFEPEGLARGFAW